MAFLDFLTDRNSSRRPTVAEISREQKPESLKKAGTPQVAAKLATPTGQLSQAEQTKADRIMSTLERATRHRDTQTPMDAPANVDAASEKLARAMRFVDTTARPKPQQPPQFKWPRPPASWER